MSFRKVNPALTIGLGIILLFLAEVLAAIFGFIFHAAFNVYWYYDFLVLMILILYGLAAFRFGGWRAVPYLFVGFIIALVILYVIADIMVSLMLGAMP